MKEQFKHIIQKYMQPWVDGAAGTPWAFTTDQLMVFADDNIQPEIKVDQDGEITKVGISREDVVESMCEMGFERSAFVDPVYGMKTHWEIEALPTLIL